MCVFLILAICGLYGGMRMEMGFAGRGNEKDNTKNENKRT
jgi:dihydroxyacetone kinase